MMKLPSLKIVSGSYFKLAERICLVYMRALFYQMHLPRIILQKMHLLGKYGLLQYRSDCPQPTITEPLQVLLKTHLGGICGTDLHQIHTSMSYFASIWSGEQQYSPLGHEIVAEVVATGSAVTELAPGTRVILNPVSRCATLGISPCPACQAGNWGQCSAIVKTHVQSGKGLSGGGYNEFFLAYAKQLYPIPVDLPDVVAVLTEPFAVALTAVFRHPPQNHDTVVIFGAGIIGLMIVSAIRAINSKTQIIVVARYPFQAESVRLLGANQVLTNPTSNTIVTTLVSLTSATMVTPFFSSPALFGGSGPDIIYDSIATEESMNTALRSIKSNGTIVVVGLGYTVTKNIDWAIPVYKETTVVGSMMHGLCRRDNQLIDPFVFAIDYLHSHQDLFQRLVTHHFPIERYKQAFQAHEQKKQSHAIKIVFDWGLTPS